jgi:hypothetical protein
MNILFMGMPAHNMATITPLTNGDNPGVATGVASGTVMGPSRHLTGAFTVLLKVPRHAIDQRESAKFHQCDWYAYRAEPVQSADAGAVITGQEYIQA